MSKLLDFNSDPINKVLKKLLKDKTTNKNIIWATNTFEHLGREFDDKKEISDAVFKMGFSLSPRISKSEEEKLNRTRNKAEVFTPSWIVNEMNNYIDEEWFGRNNVFNKSCGNTWEANPEKIEFPKNKTWQDYVKLKVLEITCGEGPYLVSRYDASNGEIIENTIDRIGVLDRKLRVVDENTNTKEDWINWAIKAVESIYGYEYQGDNLLIARVNILMSFVEFYRNRWNEDPDIKILNKISNIISWNIWQMDGLKDIVPHAAVKEIEKQLNIFDIIDDDNAEVEFENIYCKVRDWRRRESVHFREYKERDMKKFDFVIGNPPYQEETNIKETKNGMKRRKSVFQYFQQTADKICSSSVLIYPAVRWIHQGGKGMKQFGFEQINDPHLAKLVYFPNVKDVFKDADLTDGISIVIKNQNKKRSGFDYEYRGENPKIVKNVNNPGENLFVLNPDDIEIADKFNNFVNKNNLKFLFDSIGSQKLFGIESSFVENNPDKVISLEEVKNFNPETEVKILTNDISGSAGRAKWYITDKNNIPKSKELINKWKVVVSSAHPGGQDNRSNMLEVIDNQSVFGRSKVALKTFDTMIEARNFYKYMDSKIIRYSLLLTNEALSSVAKYTPDLLNYKEENEFLEYSQDLDLQLKGLFRLSDLEFNYINEVIDSQRRDK